jgi:hypothetical protein
MLTFLKATITVGAHKWPLITRHSWASIADIIIVLEKSTQKCGNGSIGHPLVMCLVRSRGKPYLCFPSIATSHITKCNSSSTWSHIHPLLMHLFWPHRKPYLCFAGRVTKHNSSSYGRELGSFTHLSAVGSLGQRCPLRC